MKSPAERFVLVNKRLKKLEDLVKKLKVRLKELEQFVETLS